MRFYRLILSFIVMAILMPAAALGHNANTDTVSGQRPRIGFVLGGGGARGAAHIGVLKYLYDQGIPVDYVVGNSMGSIIGALYCVGYTPAELEDLIAKMDWNIYMKDAVPRDKMSMSEKNRKEQYLITIPFNSTNSIRKILRRNNNSTENGDIISTLPSSLVSGANLLNLFNSLCFGYNDSIDFHDLPISFACIATDVRTGEEVVMQSGRLPLSIRASMAIPGLFAPVMIDGRLLVDGGLVNNFPTDVCKKMGADIIIGSEVAKTKIDNLDDLKSLPQLSAQLKSIIVEGKNEENRKLCDIYFKPDLAGFSMLSFNEEAIHALVKAGYEEAKKHDKEIAELKKILASYPTDASRLKAPKATFLDTTTIHINSVTINGATKKENDFLVRKCRINQRTEISGHEIADIIDIIKGTGAFSSVTYRLSKNDADTVANSYDIIFDVKKVEPQTVSLGIRYDSEESAAILLGIGINKQSLAGMKLSATARLAYNPRINATLTWSGLSFASFNFSYDFRQAKYDLHDEGNRIENNEYKKHLFTLSMTESHLKSLSMRAGIYKEIVSINESMITELYGYSKRGNTGLFTGLTFDNCDNAYLTKKGVYLNINGKLFFNDDNGYNESDFAMDKHILDINGEAKVFITPMNGRVTLMPWVMFRSISGNFSIFEWNYVGGEMKGRYAEQQLPFVGELRFGVDYNNVAIARMDVRVNIFGKHYMTAIYNFLHSIDEIEDFFSTHENYHGGGVKYTYDSMLGPISADIQYSDQSKKIGFYVSIGYDF